MPHAVIRTSSVTSSWGTHLHKWFHLFFDVSLKYLQVWHAMSNNNFGHYEPLLVCGMFGKGSVFDNMT